MNLLTSTATITRNLTISTTSGKNISRKPCLRLVSAQAKPETLELEKACEQEQNQKQEVGMELLLEYMLWSGSFEESGNPEDMFDDSASVFFASRKIEGNELCCVN